MRLKVSLLPSRLRDLLAAVERLPQRYSMGGRAGLGVLYLAVSGSPEEVNDSINIVREVVRGDAGHIAAEHVGDGVRVAEAMSSPGDALPLMQALKLRFDPLNILNPGQGPAGL